MGRPFPGKRKNVQKNPRSDPLTAHTLSKSISFKNKRKQAGAELCQAQAQLYLPAETELI
jgi:hypothetical protein